MKKNNIYILVLIVLNIFSTKTGYPQEVKKVFTLEQVIQLACEQSLDAFVAKHRYRAAYWEYKMYKASKLPKLTLRATLPDINKLIRRRIQDDGTYVYREEKTMDFAGSLSLSQSIPLTGGTLSIATDLSRNEDLNRETLNYLASPLNIIYNQPIFGYNKFKWKKKTDPLKYNRSKNQYIELMEEVKIKAANYFFSLALAQMNLQMANVNHANNDTIYRIAKGRYNMGMIAKNELLQIELNYLNSETYLNEANLELEKKMYNLRSFLGFNNTVNISLKIPKNVPKIKIDENMAAQAAMQNNTNILRLKLNELNSQSNVEAAKRARFEANIFANFGLNKSAREIPDLYRPKQMQKQVVRLGISIPLLDWGEKRGNYRMALSQQEAVELEAKQERMRFEQDIKFKVKKFNYQDEQLYIVSKADTIAKSKYEVTLQRFYIGKVNVVNLNIALQEKDSARRKYISALRQFWTSYYELRKLTMWDFEKNKKIEADYDHLLQK